MASSCDRLCKGGELAQVDILVLGKFLRQLSETAHGKRMKRFGFVQLTNIGGRLSVMSTPLLSLLVISCCMVSALRGAETVTVNKEFHKREIKVRVGGLIRLNLEEQGTTGYVWKVQNLHADHFEMLSEQTKEAPKPNEITGAPITRTWLLRAKKAGQSELKLINYRPWEDEKNPADTFVLRVRIVP